MMERKTVRRTRGRSDTAERLTFLCELRPVICSEVSTTLMLQRVARLIAGSLCEFCVVDLVEDDGVRRIEIAHADASLVDHLRVVAEDFVPTPGGRIERMIASAEPELVPSTRTAPKRTASGMRPALKGRLVKQPQGSSYLDFWPGFPVASYLSVPVKVAGQVRAIITFASPRPSTRYDVERLSFALEIAGWCGLALEVNRTAAQAGLREATPFPPESPTAVGRKRRTSSVVPAPATEAVAVRTRERKVAH